jgi:hypothetical protein
MYEKDIKLGDLVKYELADPARHPNRSRYWNLGGSTWKDLGATGLWEHSPVVDICPGLYFTTVLQDKFGDKHYINWPFVGSGWWDDSLWLLEGWVEKIGAPKAKPVPTACECGKDKAGDCGAHSSWCPKYEEF